MSLGNTITLSNGVKLPQIGLGTWLSEPKEVEFSVRRFDPINIPLKETFAMIG